MQRGPYKSDGVCCAVPTGPDDVIRRYRGAALEHDPLYTFFDTGPRIGMEIYVDGNSLDVAFVIADRMARHGYSENRTIVATGCLRGNDGIVGRVDGFERKVLLLHKSDLRGFLFIFPKANFIESVRDALQHLQEDCRAECVPIENLEEVKFLWETGINLARPVKWRWCLTALALATVVSFTAVLLLPVEKPLPAPPRPPLNAVLDKRINTASDNGAYQTQFCPRLLAAVANVLFRGYDPENAIFKLITETDLTIIPVISKEILDILQWDGQPVYQQRTFKTKPSGPFDVLDIFAKQVTTA